MKIFRRYRTLLIFAGSIIIGFTIFILSLSPLAKYFAEKYVQKVTGRQIRMSWVYINPFTRYINIHNLKIYESKTFEGYKAGDSIFFTVKDLSARFSILKLFSKTIEITEVTLDQPDGVAIQNRNLWNFSDLVKRFSPVKGSPSHSSIHFTITGIVIKNGIFRYREKVTPVNYFIKEAQIECTGKIWNVDTMTVKYAFASGPDDGFIRGTFKMNFKSLDYRFSFQILKFDLKNLEPYLRSLTTYGKITAGLDADLVATGNFRDKENLDAVGKVAVNNFHFMKKQGDDYASFVKLVLTINKLSPVNHDYKFDSVILTHPYFKYERYDYLDNLQRMVGGSNQKTVRAGQGQFNLVLTLAEYFKGLVRNIFNSKFSLKKIAIIDGDFKYNDFSIGEKFSIDAAPLAFNADSIDKSRDRVNVSLRTGIQPYGAITVKMSINPGTGDDFDLDYNLDKLPLSLFNPYLVTYTSYPVNRGTIKVNGIWHVKGGKIESTNHLLIIDPFVTSRLKNKLTRWIPTSVIMFFTREKGNVINYKIPITGNLKDPSFHLHDVVIHILENIFVKTVSTGYRTEVSNVETAVDKSLAIKWAMRQNTLLPIQTKFIEKMGEFLEKNPEARIIVSPMQYARKEKEYILFFEAKKKYFLSLNKNVATLDKKDSLEIDRMSIKDTLFNHYLDQKVQDTTLFTVQDKCIRLLDSAVINARFEQLTRNREENFLEIFKRKNLVDRVKINPSENIIPYNGFSFFKITYKPGFPDYLMSAYQKLEELNDSPPRNRFEKERRNIRTTIRDKQDVSNKNQGP